MSIALPWDLEDVKYPFPSSNSSADAVLTGASTGSAVGSIIPFLGTTVGGVVGAAIAFFRTLGSGTPRLGWEKANVIARQVSAPIQKLLNDAGYFQDPIFRDIFRRNYVAYVSSTNPGEAGRRNEYLNRSDGGLDNPEIVWLTYIWSLEGVSSMPDDPWPINKRLEQASNDVVLKSISEYEKAKGISSGIASFKVNPDGTVETLKAGFDVLSLLLVGGAVVGLLATRKKRK